MANAIAPTLAIEIFRLLAPPVLVSEVVVFPEMVVVHVVLKTKSPLYVNGAEPTPVELKQISSERVVTAFEEKVMSAH